MGLKVIDRASGKEIPVSGEEAQRGLIEGRYVLPTGVRPQAQAPDGRLGTVDPTRIREALSEGFKLLSPEEAREKRVRQEESTAAAQALGAAEAVGAGLTLGGLPYAATELGLTTPERQRVRRENLGGIGTALEIGGAIAPALVTGGAGAAAGAARAGLAAKAALRATPAGLVARAGVAAERALAPRVGAGAARQLVPVAGRGAVEGVAFGAGAEVHESVLGEREISAERLLASGVMGGLLGGAGSAGLAALPLLARGTSKIAQRSVRGVLGAATGGEGGSMGLARALAKGQALVSGADEAKLLRAGPAAAADPKQWARVRRVIDDPQVAERETADALSDVMARNNAAGVESRRLIGGPAKMRAMEKYLPGEGRVTTPSGLRQAQRTLPQVADELDAIELRLNAMADAGPGFYGHQGDVRRLLGFTRAAKAELTSRPSMKTAFRVMDSLKRDIDGITQPVMQAVRKGGVLNSADRAAIDELLGTARTPGMAHRLRSFLTDEDHWGKAARVQKEINASTSAAMQAEDLARKVGLGKILQNIDNRAFDEADRRAVMRMARAIGKEQGEQQERLLLNALDARLNQARVMNKYYDLGDVGKKNLATMEHLRKDLNRVMREKSEDVALLADLEHLRVAEGNRSVSIGLMTTMGPVSGLALGGLAGGPVGAAVGGLVGSVLSRPSTTVRSMAGIHRLLERHGVDVKSSVGRFFSGGKAAARRTLGGVRRALPAVSGKAAAKKEDRRDRHKKVRTALASYQASPSLLNERVNQHTEFLQHLAPGLSRTIAAKSVTAAAFLASKLPASYQPSWGGEPMVDDGELARFERYHEVVENPVVALEKLADGNLTLEHAEALQAVYPAIFADIQTQLWDGLAEAKIKGRVIPHAKRVRLGILFDAPLDDSLKPESMALTQAALADTGEQPAPKPTRGVPKPLAQNYETPMSRLEQQSYG